MLTLYKQAYSGLSDSTWRLSIITLINRSGTMVVAFLTIYCINKLNFSLIQAGYILSLFGLGSILGGFLGGELTKRFGFYYVQIGSLIAGGVCFILFGQLHTFLQIIIGIFILSLCIETFQPANSVAIAHYSVESNRTRSYSLNRLAINLGWSIGGMLGGILASINYQFLFWIDGLTNILAAIFLFCLIPPTETMTEDIRSTKYDRQSKSAYKDRVFLLFVFLATLYSIGFSQFFILQPVFFKLAWHFSEQLIGILMALNGILIVLFEMVLINYLENKRKPLFYLTVGSLFTFLAFIMIVLVPANFGIALFIIALYTIGEIIFFPFMNAFWSGRSSVEKRGEYAGLLSISFSFARLVSPLVSGIIIQRAGFSVLWLFLAALCLIAGLGYFAMHRYDK